MKRQSLTTQAIIGCILIVVSPFIMQAQSVTSFPILEQYCKWSIVAGPVIYNQAAVVAQQDGLTIKSNPMLGLNAGFEYDFYPEKRWSFSTGLLVAIEPAYNINYNISNTDLIPENFSGEYKEYTRVSFSTPLLMRLNIQTGNKTFICFQTGLKMMYFPNNKIELGHGVNDQENFKMKIESPDNSFQGSFIVGAGFLYATKKALLKARVIYVMNFQNTISGEYEFANSSISFDNKGHYDLSGNYVGLMFSIGLKKCKNKFIK